MQRRTFIRNGLVWLAAHGVASSALLTAEASMDTSNWKTYPVGRYLIDLPADAEFYWHPLRFNRRFDLVWKKGMTIEQANSLLREEAEEAKQSPHKTKGNQFIDFSENYGTDNLGTTLGRYPNAYSDSHLYKIYVVNRVPRANPHFEQRVYYHEKQVINIASYRRNAIEFLNWMSTNILPTDPSLPLNVTDASYFEGGFLYGPSNIPWPGREEIGIEVTFPEHPGIQFSIYFDHIEMDTEGGRPNTTLAGRPARESLHTFIKNDITHYNFSLHVPSKEDVFHKPEIFMHLKNPIGGVMRKGVSTIKPPIRRPSFTSKEEAMVFWQRIRESVRWRPDGRIVESPDFAYYIVNGKIVPAVFDDTEE